MFDIWKNLADLVRVDYRHVRTTNIVFTLHSKVTVIILVAFSILVTSRQYLGDPIDCISSQDIKSVADKYCWIHSTFTRARLGSDGKFERYEAVAEGEFEAENSELSPGIRPEVEAYDPRIYHTYYQWVWAFLFIQAGFFYIPYWIWRICDRGRIKMLVADLNLRVLSDEEQVLKEKEAILRYFKPNRGYHDLYAWQYIACEALNFLNVILQIYWTNVFLNYEFTSYGMEIFSLTQKKPYARSDELARVFPVVTACRLATGGPAFNAQEYDLLCVLNINILNEKIYIFIWFWFVILVGLSTLNFFYRLATIFIPKFRSYLLLRFLRMRRDRKNFAEMKIGYGDWFILYKLGENLNPIVFSELLQEILESEEAIEEDEKLSLKAKSICVELNSFQEKQSDL